MLLSRGVFDVIKCHTSWMHHLRSHQKGNGVYCMYSILLPLLKIAYAITSNYIYLTHSSAGISHEVIPTLSLGKRCKQLPMCSYLKQLNCIQVVFCNKIYLNKWSQHIQTGRCFLDRVGLIYLWSKVSACWFFTLQAMFLNKQFPQLKDRAVNITYICYSQQIPWKDQN